MAAPGQILVTFPRPSAPVEAAIDLHEAARRLGVSYRTVWRRVQSGDLPAMRVGRVWRVKPADLETFSRARAVAVERGRRAADTLAPPRPRHGRHKIGGVQ